MAFTQRWENAYIAPHRAAKENTMEPRDRRSSKRHLPIEFGRPLFSKPSDGDSLQFGDLADAEHWVSVYGELLEVRRSVVEPAAGGQPGEDGPAESRLAILQAMVYELHLAYWTDRLRRLSAGSDANRPR